MTIRRYQNGVAFIYEDRAAVFYEAGRVYLGGWAGDRKAGVGLESQPGLFVFEGQFSRGRRHGLGTLWRFSRGHVEVYRGYLQQ
jgi:hypothetical protein